MDVEQVMRHGWTSAVVAAASAVVLSLLAPGTAQAATASGLSATTVNGHAHRIDLAWSNPDSENVVLQMSTDTYPADGTVGHRVYTGTGTAVVLDDVLTYRTTYYFTLFTVVGATYTADGQALATTPLRPVGKPVLSNGSDSRQPKIRVDFTRSCSASGCFRVNWTTGSAAYPASPFATSHEATLGSTSPQKFGVWRDLTTYNVSLWQVGPGNIYGSAVHRRIRLPEWLPGLRVGAVDAGVTGGHSIDVDWATPKHHSKALKQLRLYQSESRTAPGTATRLPSGAPIWRCDWPCSRHTIHVDHLRTLAPYTYSMYGADAHGHVRRVVSNTEFPRVEGFYEGAELIDRQLSRPHSTVRDRRDRTHLVSVRASGALRYVIRASGSSTWVRHDVPGLTFAAEDDAQLVLGLSQSGNRVYLATYCIGGTGTSEQNIYLTSKPANGDFDTPISVLDVAGSGACDAEAGGDRPTVGLGDVTADTDNDAVLAYSMCDSDAQPGDNCSTRIVRQLPGQPIETTPVVAGTNWLPVGRPRVAVSDQDDYVLVQAGTLAGVFGVYAWTKDSGQSAWSAPTRLDGSVVDGVAIAHGMTWLAVTQRDSGSDNGLYLLRRPVGGSWHGPTRVPHTDAHDAAPLVWPLVYPPTGAAALAVNSATGVLDLVYTRAFPKTQWGGLRHLRRHADGTWTRPQTLTSWWKDVPHDLMLTSTGAIRYSYLRY
jgi:hypothetical protein